MVGVGWESRSNHCIHWKMPSIIKIPLNDALTQQPIVFKLIPGNCSCYILRIQREAADHSGFIQSDLRADIIVLT